MSSVQDLLKKTLGLVIDMRHKEGFEEIDASFEAFMELSSIDDFQNSNAFNVQKLGKQHFTQEKILEYLQLINDNDKAGVEGCSIVVQYIIVVLSKYLFMMASYHLYKEDISKATAVYEWFNQKFQMMKDIYIKVTGEELEFKIDIGKQKSVGLDKFTLHISRVR